MLATASPTPDDSTFATAWSYFRWLHELMPEPFFYTQAFLVFLAIVGLVYWIIPKRFNTVRVWWLVVASFHFYAAWSAELAFLVLGTTLADFAMARLIEAATTRRRKLFWLLLSLAMNVGLLAYFKYKNFFLDSINEGLAAMGQDRAFSTLKVMIPFGISFYTFEAISYIVDVYRGRVKAERSLPHFVLFILFFPHLVSGPIVRARDFLHQTKRCKPLNWLRFQVGVQFFLIGLFKKIVIADRMLQLYEPVLSHPLEYSTAAAWMSVLAFAIGLYMDFSGYSDMAVGLAHLFGYRLCKNFDAPYLAVNISEFWRRWHISLSNWLRDYVFIPLGGSRGSTWQTNRNLMITMLLGGLWHGAAWTYIVWGGLHGLLLIGHRAFRTWCEARPWADGLLTSRLGTAWRIAITFIVVALAWTFFRPDWAGAMQLWKKLLGITTGKPLLLSNRYVWVIVGCVFAGMLLWRSQWLQRLATKLHPALVGAAYASCLCGAMLLAPPVGKPFRYFDF